MKDQLSRGRVVVCSCPLGVQVQGFPQVVQAKVNPHLCSAQGPPCTAIKQSEMAATCAGLGDSQGMPKCESRQAAASARPGAT